MSAESYKVPAEDWQTELEIKRSKFLTFVGNATSKVKADSFIKQLRDLHPKANHVCWAYIAGSPQSTTRSMSDDGEPSGTAGMPMLKVIEHSGLGDIVVAVVRYFGGTKLGTGGLQRAYSDAVSQALEDLPTQVKVSRTTILLEYDYAHDGSITQLINRYDTENVVAEYLDRVHLQIDIAQTEQAQFKSEVVNVTAGGVEIQEL
ncbi:YigZ family protein [Alteromonadaceae bacterium M269]|nr:YigZ family protein [Alteromonadaceae bacterium M269]